MKTIQAWQWVAVVTCAGILPVVHAGQADTLWSRCSPAAIRNDGVETSRLEIATTSRVTAVRVLGANSLHGLRVDGVAFSNEALYDDGTRGDRVAGDKVFSRGGLSTFLSPRLREGLLDRFTFESVQLTIGGQNIVVTLDPEAAAQLGVVSATYTGATAGPPSVRRSARAAGLVVPAAVWLEFGSADSLAQTARRFYQHFPDAYDFLYLFADRGMAGTELTRPRHLIVRSYVQGIGLPAIDQGEIFGSPAALQGVVAMPFSPAVSLLRETIKQWAVYLDESFGFGRSATESYPGYWGYAGVGGSLGGFDPATLTRRDEETWLVRGFLPYRGAHDRTSYAKAELYLAGLAEPEEVPPIPVLIDAAVRGVQLPYLIIGASALREVSVEEIIARHGPRLPAYQPGGERVLRGAFVVVSTEPVSDSTLLFVDALAYLFSRPLRGDQLSAAADLTFYAATNGRARMDTVLDPGLLTATPSPSPTPSAVPTSAATVTPSAAPSPSSWLVQLFALSRAWSGAAADRQGLFDLIRRR